jgi:hypothetical protein
MTPSEKQLTKHFQSRAVQELLQKLIVADSGMSRRISAKQLGYNSTLFRVRLKASEKGEPAPKPKTQVQVSGSEEAHKTLSTPPPQKRARTQAHTGEDDEVAMGSSRPQQIR